MINSSHRRPMIEDFLPKNQKEIMLCCCLICGFIVSNPVSDQKGHLFCKECVIEYITTKSTCPASTDCILSLNTITEIPSLASYIRSHEIKCLNQIKGCTWIGLYSLLETHLGSQCFKQETSCIYKTNGCEVSLLREGLNEHTLSCPFRSIKCKNNCSTNEVIIFKEEQTHLDKCPNEVINCPNNCGVSFERKFLTEHCILCAQAVFLCPYEEYGCTTRVLNKDRDRHFVSLVHQHNSLVIDYVKKTQEAIKSKTQSINDIQKNLNDKIDKCLKLMTKLYIAERETKLKEEKAITIEQKEKVTAIEEKAKAISIEEKEREKALTIEDKDKDIEHEMMFLKNKTEREQNDYADEFIEEEYEDDDETREQKRKLVEKLSLSLFSYPK